MTLVSIVATNIRQQYEVAGTRTIARQMQRRSDIQEQRESTPAVVAATEIDVQPLRRNAGIWNGVWVVSIALTLLFLGIARRHYEKQRRVWVPVIVLLMFSLMFALLIL
jgi:hypothetical protein